MMMLAEMTASEVIAQLLCVCVCVSRLSMSDHFADTGTHENSGRFSLFYVERSFR